MDDEPDLLKMVFDILKDAGFQKILTATTGKNAVAEAKKGKPDLIILDVMLPDGDGFSLMQQLRSFTDVPIIFLTAKDETADKLAGLGLGADDYIVKPFLPQELVLRIYAVLRRSYKEDDPLVVLDGCTVDFARAEVHKGNTVDGLLVLGYPKNSYMKLTSNYYSITAIQRLPLFLMGMLGVDIVCLFLAYYCSRRKIIRNTEPIVAAVEKLSDGCKICLALECTKKCVKNCLILSVTDDGIGISTEKQRELEEKPHYMESTDERLDLRHGLGLLIVQ